MKKCPECLAINEDSSVFCNKCGQKLRTVRSNSFRNFIISIISIMSIIVIGAIIYFVLANFAQIDFSSFLNKGQESADAENSGTAILSKEELSADQTRVISLFGYPDQFMIIFDESYENKRIDTWIYFDMEALFIFENGTYDSSEQYYGGKSQESEYEVLPQDFMYAMTPLEVETLIGYDGTESIDESTGLNILTFGGGEIICIFNPDNELIIASKQNKLSDET